MQRISETQAVNNVLTTSYYGYDGMGTVRQLTNASGAITDTYDYDAFGNLVNSTGTTPNNYLYRGEQWDADLGLYYLRARYYNLATGRFMSRDPLNGKPINPKSLHKYMYTEGDPINLIDPTGQESLWERVKFTITIVAVAGSQYVQRMNGQEIVSAVGSLACFGADLSDKYDAVGSFLEEEFDINLPGHGEIEPPNPAQNALCESFK